MNAVHSNQHLETKGFYASRSSSDHAAKLHELMKEALKIEMLRREGKISDQEAERQIELLKTRDRSFVMRVLGW